MKPFVDVGAIAGGSSSGIGGLFIFFVLILFFIKRKIRDEKRAVMLLGKSEEEKNKLLDEWGIGYQAKRQKEIQKAMKKHKKEELHKKKLKLKAQKRIAKRKKELEKRIEKVNANHDKKRFSTNFSSARERRNEAKRKTERKKRLEALGVTQAEIDRVEQQEHPELAALEMEDVAIKRIEDSFGNIEASDVRSEEFLGRGKYSKRRRSNVAVIVVRIVFISSFFFCCLLVNHSFPTNPNSITNCFKLFSLLQLTTTLLLRRFLIFEQVVESLVKDKVQLKKVNLVVIWAFN